MSTPSNELLSISTSRFSKAWRMQELVVKLEGVCIEARRAAGIPCASLPVRHGLVRKPSFCSKASSCLPSLPLPGHLAAAEGAQPAHLAISWGNTGLATESIVGRRSQDSGYFEQAQLLVPLLFCKTACCCHQSVKIALE